MSLKLIELQIAIPKTFEAGKITEQKNQQSALNHQQTAVQTDQQVVRQRTTVTESSLSEKAKNNGDSSSEGNAEEDNQEKNVQENKHIHVSHPYKGGFVDYTG